VKPLTGLFILSGVAAAIGIAIALEKSAQATKPTNIPPPGVLPTQAKTCPAPSPGTTTAHAPQTLTAHYAATGTTLQMTVGDKLQTELLLTPPGSDWTLASSDANILALDPNAVHAMMQDPTGLGTDVVDIWDAVGPGTCTVSGTQTGMGGKFSLTVNVGCPT